MLTSNIIYFNQVSDMINSEITDLNTEIQIYRNEMDKRQKETALLQKNVKEQNK